MSRFFALMTTSFEPLTWLRSNSLQEPTRTKRRSENKRTQTSLSLLLPRVEAPSQNPFAETFSPIMGATKAANAPSNILRRLVGACGAVPPNIRSRNASGLGKMLLARPRPKERVEARDRLCPRTNQEPREEESQEERQERRQEDNRKDSPRENPRQRRDHNPSPSPRQKPNHPLIKLKRVLPHYPGLRTTTVTPLLPALQMLQFLLPGVFPWITLPMRVPSILPSILPSIQVSLWMIKAFAPHSRYRRYTLPFAFALALSRASCSCKTHSLEGCFRHFSPCPLV